MELKGFEKIKFKFKKMDFKNLGEVIKEKNYEKEMKKKIKPRTEPYEDVTDFKTVKEFFFQAVEKYPERPCILEKPSHSEPYKETTYKEVYNDIISFGTALVEKYNLKDKRVIIIGEAQYDWYLSYLTLLCGGILAIPVDKDLPLNELENIINRSKASAIIYTAKRAGDMKKLISNGVNVEYFIEMKNNGLLENKIVGIKNVIEEGKKLVEEGNDKFKDIEIDPEEFKILFFTSGTTSNSKGVMLCNRNLAANVNGVCPYAKFYPTDRLLSILPLHHCYESTIGFLTPIAFGASIAVCEGLKYIVPNMQEAKPTILLSVPLLVETLHKRINDKIVKSKKEQLINTMISLTNMLKEKGINVKRTVFNEIHENLGGNLRIIVSAAAPIDPKVGQWIEDIGIKFLQGYGLTETAPLAALTPEYQTLVGSVGKSIVQGEIKIDAPNENGEGEILIKTPTLMMGYYEDEEATNKVMSKDGWFYSGDIGYMDEKGNIFITGRSKNVIVTQNDKNIYPEEIEFLLGKIEEIKECFVYGKKPENDKKNEKELIITVKAIPNHDKIKELYGEKTDLEIYDIIWKKIKEVNKELSSYKAIKLLEIKEGEFEKTSTMKIKRYKEING